MFERACGWLPRCCAARLGSSIPTCSIELQRNKAKEMEIVIGVIALLIAVLLWLFPPEPLRRLLGVKEPGPIDGGQDYTARDLTNALKTSIEALEIVEDNSYFGLRAPALMKLSVPPRIIERSQREPLLRWIDTLDDELLLVTLEIRDYWRGKDWRAGVPRSFLVSVAQPLGSGRSTPDLEKALIETGVLAPSETPGHFNYGPNLQQALDYIDLIDWNKLKNSVVENHLEERAKRGRKERFDASMRKVADIDPPEERDHF